MAKMFYTIEEVATKLGKNEDEVMDMVRAGQIQEFRDREKLMFKKDQIDLLAHDEDTGEVHLDLEDTSGGSASGLGLKDDTGLGLADSRTGTGAGLADSAGLGLGDSSGDSGLADSHGTGISVFDTDHGGEDASEQTHAGDAVEEELTLEAVGSGSGLLDLTRESDDTSLGAELLEEVYSGDEQVEIPANASGLFEAAGAESSGDQVATAQAMAMPMVVEAYDGSGSGLSAGLLIGAIAALVCVAIVTVVAVFSGATADLTTKFAENLWMWVGGLAGVTIIAGVVGLFIGKASE